MGKMFLDASKEAAQTGHGENLSLTSVAHLMLMADQPASSIDNITQIGLLADQHGTVTSPQEPTLRRRQRGSRGKSSGSSAPSLTPVPSDASSFHLVEESADHHHE
mmetsp:Transcript_21039/g.44862  ORF Transcript_21039/g.44862 Transcript_21039/m.44862 type:complete len:106 (-) Transcript_21039:663-980(-)